MKTSFGSIPALGAALILAGLLIIPVSAAGQAPSPKDGTVKKYLDGCQDKPATDANCAKARKEAVEILKEDLLTLGSSADHGFLLSILPAFKREETELRIAAADAIGMIGPQDQDIDVLAPLANDPVPDVRRAVSQMLSHGKGNAFNLLAQRTSSMRMGLTPETPPDPGVFKLPMAPASTYLFYSSDAAVGRLSYLSKHMNELAAFFKGKAKNGPFKLDEFKDRFRYQLKDEDEAGDRARKEKSKELEKQLASLKPDPANPAYMEKMLQLQSENLSTLGTFFETYRPELYGTPTVYVLEERQIGQRTYPTRYAVLYQDLAIRKPGYRLSWMTVSDDAIKAVQTATLAEEKQELADKKEAEALKKREAAQEAMEKKKDAAEKKQFKKGQEDLEKALGF